MKNIKKLFLMSFFAIAALVLVGMTDVKAAGDLIFGQPSGSDIVCDPKSVAPGEPSLCYFVGQPDSTTASMYGYIMHAFTTKKLKLVGVETAVQGAQAVYTDISSMLDGEQAITKQADMTDNVAAFKCTYVSDDSVTNTIENATSYGCGIFYTTKNTSTDAFTGSSIVDAAKALNLTTLPTGYGVVGAFKVELDETATATECGEICVKVFGAPTDAQFNASADENTHYKSCGNVVDKIAGCGAVEDHFDCIEVSYQGSGELPSQSPPTGAFASYALLVAGALIAISAIALAKKNNKLYRV